ncbi:uncharacterized protein CTRU02_210065 [Colletotrichum truncatum]|uniref:Uncharacterized protein n=1 Tax=Colletotrichum truncatum TaxID=5467 RepID=A0ACC3YU82_COLTU
MVKNTGIPTRSEGIVEADVGVAGVDTLVVKEVEGDWLPLGLLAVKAMVGVKVELGDTEAKPGAVETRAVVDESVLGVRPGEEVPLFKRLEEGMLNVDAEPAPEIEAVLLFD